jgi:hypothetical protein
MDWNETFTWTSSPRSTIGYVQTISKPMVHLEQTMWWGHPPLLPAGKDTAKKRPSGLVVVGRRPCEPLNNHTLLSLGGGSHLKRESHSSPIGLVFYGHWAFLRVGVHKNCWGPGNLNLLGLGQPHLGQMYHLVSESGPCLRGGNDEDILHYYLLAKTQ